MFSIDNKELVIGGNIWVIKFDLNSTSLDSIGLPKMYEYTGRYSPDNGDPEFIRLYDKSTNKQFRINVDMSYSGMLTGFYMLSKSRQDIFHRISRLTKYNSSADVRFIAKKYVEFLKENHPEYVI